MINQFDRVCMDHSPSSIPFHPAQSGLRDTFSFESRYISVIALGDAEELGGHMYETQVRTCSKKCSIRLKSSRRASDDLKMTEGSRLQVYFYSSGQEARARMIGPLEKSAVFCVLSGSS